MNLQVNLLDPGERHSPGGVLLRASMRIGAVLGVALLLGFAFWLALEVSREQTKLSAAKGQWQRIEPELRHAEALREAALAQTRQLGELRAFSNAQLRVTERLHAIARAVPEQVQLTEVSLSEKTVEAASQPARQFEIRLLGRRGGGQEVASADVQALIGRCGVQMLQDAALLK